MEQLSKVTQDALKIHGKWDNQKLLWMQNISIWIIFRKVMADVKRHCRKALIVIVFAPKAIFELRCEVVEVHCWAVVERNWELQALPLLMVVRAGDIRWVPARLPEPRSCLLGRQHARSCFIFTPECGADSTALPAPGGVCLNMQNTGNRLNLFSKFGGMSRFSPDAIRISEQLLCSGTR